MSEDSKALKLATAMGWNTRPSGDGENHALEHCPLDPAHKPWKFYINVEGEKDGLWKCVVCEQSGNLYQLKRDLGINLDTTTETVSLREAGQSRGTPGALIDYQSAHRRLMDDEAFSDVLDYLVAERKFRLDVIERMKLGATKMNVRDSNGNNTGDQVNAYVIPYFSNGQYSFFKARSLPPAKKQFAAPANRNAPLYNGDVLKSGMDELVMVEGESDCLALLSQGYDTVVGIPGAGVKKTTWVDKLDSLAPKTVYLCYDSDKVGQQGAKEMAAKIGLERCRNIVLPTFELYEGQDEEGHDVYRAGKDLNEWFAAGHTLEDFKELQARAAHFGVDGVYSTSEVLERFADQFDVQGTEPTFISPWPSLNRKIGGFEEGEVCGVLAPEKTGKTTFVLNWLDWLAQEKGIPSALICGEVKPERLVRKWISHKLQVDDTPNRSEMTKQHIYDGMDIAATYKADLLFGATVRNEPKLVFETMRQLKRRYGVRAIAYDNLYLLCRDYKHSAGEIFTISKQFKEIAMELSIFLILVLQPRKVDDDKVLDSNDIHGSGGPAKDVDGNIVLWRPRVGKIRAQEFHGFMDTEEAFDPHMLVRADLTRNAPGGTCTLYMDGARSTVREVGGEAAEMAAAHAPAGAIEVKELVVA